MHNIYNDVAEDIPSENANMFNHTSILWFICTERKRNISTVDFQSVMSNMKHVHFFEIHWWSVENTECLLKTYFDIFRKDVLAKKNYILYDFHEIDDIQRGFNFCSFTKEYDLDIKFDTCFLRIQIEDETCTTSGGCMIMKTDKTARNVLWISSLSALSRNGPWHLIPFQKLVCWALNAVMSGSWIWSERQTHFPSLLNFKIVPTFFMIP